MTRIAHLSDLHFGRTDPDQLDALAKTLHADGITRVIVSGDLTQSGRKQEFAEARAWFEDLRMPVLAVPGNHDVPVINLVRRFFAPWDRYGQIGGLEAQPVHRSGDVIVAGLNSARRMRPSLDWSTGRIDDSQISLLRDAFEDTDGAISICTFHHPVTGFDDGGSAGRAVVPQADEVLRDLSDAGTDILMTGHVHKARISLIGGPARNIIYSQAGTAVSTRLRGELASYNVLTIENPHRVRLSVHRWGEGRFDKEKAQRFERADAGWEQADD